MWKTNRQYEQITAKGMSAALILAMTLTVAGCGEAGTPELKEAIHKTAEYEQKTVSSPEVGSLGGEWTVLALARSEEEVEDSYFEKYRANLEKYVKEQDGILSENRYTEYARVTLALTAIGGDPTAIGGYDLEKNLEDFDAVTAQGINGAIFALLALNADGEREGALQEKYLAYILEREKTDGGFSMDDNSDQADVDITAMALQSLEPYQNEQNIQETLDRGVGFLADAQDADGGYTAYGEKSSESISQTILALSTLGVDCNEDERFVKNDKGLYDTLMQYYQKDGSFAHTVDEKEGNPMATDQALCALVSYERMLDNKNTFYNMTDHR
ncbi:prenyltransferase/squalene oxidase repeat-containing protein [Blautia sp. MSJ-19]|uniref:prenyltransferase/squalene oxidase repeat-containing protein n=1 Tax=Blautia sp. MSJ-19 TaxID=2841517 RepID=UPI001C0ED279|nr:prenyltransferase/squalene oxidase repeat-containing protein [Blautia sp. MSJ-19]MBU5479721.1 hypothetical protein [Blautia sp. MSJ-19]